jgi:hypothetical protein
MIEEIDNRKEQTPSIKRILFSSGQKSYEDMLSALREKKEKNATNDEYAQFAVG